MSVTAGTGGENEHRSTVIPEVTGTPKVTAAVLVPLFEEEGEARVVLTRRSSTLRDHQGEVSFPGGRIDEGEDDVAAALREAWEEVGIDPVTVEVLGRFGPVGTRRTPQLVAPVIGFLPGRAELVTNSAEVECAFDVALCDLADPAVYREERWPYSGPWLPGRPLPDASGRFPMWFFETPVDTVWGMTARVLVELLLRVLGISEPSRRAVSH